MIDQPTLITFLAILSGFVFIPGPAAMLTLTRATSFDDRVSTAIGVGIAIGGLIHTAMAMFSLAFLPQFVKPEHAAVARRQGKVVGGIYCALGGRLALQER